MIEIFPDQDKEIIAILTDKDKITDEFLAKLEKENRLNNEYKRHKPIPNDSANDKNRKWLIIYERKIKNLR